jgi:hypothetical protein
VERYSYWIEFGVAPRFISRDGWKTSISALEFGLVISKAFRCLGDWMIVLRIVELDSAGEIRGTGFVLKNLICFEKWRI